MIIDQMFNQGPVPTLEKVLKFTSARQQVLLDDVANISTPGFRQKDLSVDGFQAALASQLDNSKGGGDGDLVSKPEEPASYIVFHDGNNRSAEELMTDGVKNAMMHNLMIELLRQQYATLDEALKGQPM